MNAPLKTANLGFPRIGAARELKAAVENHWAGRLDLAGLDQQAAALRQRHWQLQAARGIDITPSNDFSLYDQVLDQLVAVGATPSRFGHGRVDRAAYFQMARGDRSNAAHDGCTHGDHTAMEMTKWRDTNYHYLVPEWSADLGFMADPSKAVGEFLEARALGIHTRPVLIGPVSLLLLGKSVDGTAPLSLLPQLLVAYKTLLDALYEVGADWVQIDEPLLVGDLDDAARAAFSEAYAALASEPEKLMLASYFGSLGQNLPLAFSLPVAGVHLDLVRGAGQLEAALAAAGPTQVLSLGVIDGRNIWIADLDTAMDLVDHAVSALGAERVQVAPSCSLLHVPVDLNGENGLPNGLRDWLSFATQKLGELALIARGREAAVVPLARNRALRAARAAAPGIVDPAIRERVAAAVAKSHQRQHAYPQRAAVQQARFRLPPLPTTTIGSFPQTAEIRQLRSCWKKGELDTPAYETALEQATEACVREQEALGIDVLVHGEFERNDMVEYFGEQLSGYAFTANGWVQSYGSRCVKPPIIYGDVSRPAPMTVRWSAYAQSLTSLPMKGMLTGPVTMLQWSFVRDDLPRADVCRQIALALRDEVLDLEAAGIGMIQVDEPALREGLPLRRADWQAYLDWATTAFRMATAAVDDTTQIHTHMCYAEFNDIMDAIVALDADVISIETARSRMELLRAFEQHGYPNAVGPGVYDIHSPRVPQTAEMTALLSRAGQVLKPEQLWVNPDCGLKTRGWAETRAALAAMVQAARRLRLQPTELVTAEA
jgi:5-methyltetrahydropteroyltriglutamate--homocysteine methyltransferase